MAFHYELQDDFDAELLAALEREDESEQQTQQEGSQPPDDASSPLGGQPKVCTTATDAVNTCTTPPTTAKRRKLDAAEGASAQETGVHPPQRFTLAMLPEPLLLRVLGFLSPEDMCIVGQTSRLLRAAAKDSSLWRRLYFSRCEGRTAGEPCALLCASFAGVCCCPHHRLRCSPTPTALATGCLCDC